LVLLSAGTDAERHTFGIHEDILHEQPVLKAAPALKDTQGGPAYTGFALETLLDYWRAVEQSTLTHLPRANERRVEMDYDCARLAGRCGFSHGKFYRQGASWSNQMKTCREGRSSLKGGSIVFLDRAW
jgi:hypothetical protein